MQQSFVYIGICIFSGRAGCIDIKGYKRKGERAGGEGIQTFRKTNRKIEKSL